MLIGCFLRRRSLCRRIRVAARALFVPADAWDLCGVSTPPSPPGTAIVRTGLIDHVEEIGEISAGSLGVRSIGRLVDGGGRVVANPRDCGGCLVTAAGSVEDFTGRGLEICRLVDVGPQIVVALLVLGDRTSTWNENTDVAGGVDVADRNGGLGDIAGEIDKKDSEIRARVQEGSSVGGSRRCRQLFQRGVGWDGKWAGPRRPAPQNPADAEVAASPDHPVRSLSLMRPSCWFTSSNVNTFVDKTVTSASSSAPDLISHSSYIPVFSSSHPSLPGGSVVCGENSGTGGGLRMGHKTWKNSGLTSTIGMMPQQASCDLPREQRASFDLRIKQRVPPRTDGRERVRLTLQPGDDFRSG